MSELKVNATKVVAAADDLAQINRDINTSFSSVISAINTLDQNWSSPASYSVISKFNTIRDTFYEPRYEVMDLYSRYLRELVGAGYTATESVNKALAAAFK